MTKYSMTQDTKAPDPIATLEAEIAWREMKARYHDAAEGEDYFREREFARANMSALRQARVRLAALKETA